MLILAYIFFQHLQHQFLRAFDHICMEKARYKFLTIIIIIILLLLLLFSNHVKSQKTSLSL